MSAHQEDTNRLGDEGPIPCLICNVRIPEGVDPELQPERAPNLFRFSQRLYCLHNHGGAFSYFSVLGRYRGSGRWIRSDIQVKYLENWRCKMIYSEKQKVALEENGCWWTSKAQVEGIADWLNSVSVDELQSGLPIPNRFRPGGDLAIHQR